MSRLRAPVLLLLAACPIAQSSCERGPAPEDDTRDTGPGSLPTVDRALLAPPEGWYAASYHTVEPGRGLTWERDTSFQIRNFTVPSIFVRPDGTFVMLATSMLAPARGRWYLTSPDGLRWTPADGPIFAPDDFPLDCGNRLEDGFLLPTRDDGYRLVLEASLLDEVTDQTKWRRWCQATSADAVGFEPLGTYLYEGSPNDGGLAAVPSPIPLNDWSTLVYYVGDLYSAASAEGDGIRIARVADGADHAEPWARTNVLAQHLVDPMPVYLEGGGVRLYMTMSSHEPGIGASPGYAETDDGTTFTEPVRFLATDGPCADGVSGECLLDPVYLRLPDGRMVLYFTRLVSEPGELTTPTIGRAFATD